MKTDEHLEDLMVQWGQARAGGQALAAEDLCQGCPELLKPLRERLTILEAMSWLDEVNKHQLGDETLPDPSTLMPETCRQNKIPELAMPPETLCEKLAEAGVLTAEESRTAMREAGVDEPLTCQNLAEVLIRHGKLTPFQLRRVVEGRGAELAMGGYLVLDEIGSGGMGRVYRAHHRRMKRVVALKVLAADVINESALQRFHREIEAVGRLDHPNIVTAHDAAEAGGRHFLVMQYVEGEDLARFVARRGPLTAGQALDCLLQSARGLEYAHSKGIIHRDIKPSNLILDRSGIVKVLDLGLARLTKVEQPGDEANSDFTEDQVVMGTADYMAPEQALDTHRADQRSDIYSLGCTLHFLLTGRPVYGAPTLMGRMIAHREQPIPFLRERNPEVPEYLEAVFQKMVAKNPDDRYPSMTALLQELGGHADRSEKLDLDAESATFLTPGMLVDTSSIACRDTLCEVKPPTPEPRLNARRFRLIAAVAVVLGVIAVAVGLVASGVFRVQTPDGTIVVELEGKPIPVQINEDGTLTITDPNDGKKIDVKVEKGKRLLTLTKEGFQALALEFNLSTKDGRRLRARFEPNLEPAPLEKREMLIVSQRTGNFDIFLMTVDGSVVKNLTNHAANDMFPTWSPDGQKIAFESDRDGGSNIYMMDANGKNVTRLTNGPGLHTLPSWSPDGKNIVFQETLKDFQKLVILDIHDKAKREIPGFKGSDDGAEPSWSPDGKKIAFSSGRSGIGFRVYVMDANGGNVKEITKSKSKFGFVRPAWSPNGTRIAYSEDTGAGVEVFVCDPDGRNAKQWTYLGNANSSVAWSPDSEQIIFQHRKFGDMTSPATVFIMDADGSNQRVLLAKDGPGRAAWRPGTKEAAVKPSPDKSQILFVSQRTGNYEIFQMSLDGTGVKNLTNNPNNDMFPAWSPDGQKIAFESDRDGSSNLYMMDADGGNVKQLTKVPGGGVGIIGAHTAPAWSPDGKKILYAGPHTTRCALFVLDVQKGTTQQLTGFEGDACSDPCWSPDGKRIVFVTLRPAGWRICVMDADGKNRQDLNDAHNDSGYVYPAWSPDGKKLAYGGKTARGVEVFVCDPDGRNAKQLTARDSITSWVAWSPDSKRMIFQYHMGDTSTLHVMDADGGNQRELLAKDGPGRAVWRPVMKEAAAKPPPASLEQPQFLYASKRTGSFDIYLMRQDGTVIKNLTNHPAQDEYPTWSPDGKRIAFVSNRDGPANIYMMDAGGENVKQLTFGPATPLMPTWSPDGKTILFAGVSPHGAHIFALDVQQGTKQQLTAESYNGSSDPTWSPDGKKIAFASPHSGEFRIYVMDADGANVKEIASCKSNMGFVHTAWSPDGKKLAYSVVHPGTSVEVYVCDPDGRNPKQLTNLGGINAWAAWSPDSKQIIFQHREFGRGWVPGPLYIIDADGGNQRVLLQRDGPSRAAWRPIIKKALRQPGT